MYPSFRNLFSTFTFKFLHYFLSKNTIKRTKRKTKMVGTFTHVPIPADPPGWSGGRYCSQYLKRAEREQKAQAASTE